jgi:hypothetical protein
MLIYLSEGLDETLACLVEVMNSNLDGWTPVQHNREAHLMAC